MPLVSINPSTGKKMIEVAELSDLEVKERLAKGQEAFLGWKKLSFAERGKYFLNAAKLLKDKARKYGEIMTKEMGKPIKQAVMEAEKCALVCEYYAENAEKFLAKEMVETDASESYVQYDPLGIVLAVMPWNFPFWQVFRAAAPIMMAGNAMLLKHASNVPECALMIEKIFKDAGFPEDVFQYLPIESSQVEGLINDDRVKAATLTGSEYAGGQVAMECGKQIKKTLLELGGSDPFIVLADADLEKSSSTAVNARFQNNGQSCIAAKRFIVVESVYDEFLERFRRNLSEKLLGDPLDEKNDFGPLATEKILKDLELQVEQSVEMGARVVAGGKRATGLDGVRVAGFFYEPTILADVKKGMKVWDEETFGPVAAVIRARDTDEALAMANDTRFGLGASVWTADVEAAKNWAFMVQSGAFFINGMVKSDPRLPFGGTKKSGYGRELSSFGIREFTNVRCVWVG